MSNSPVVVDTASNVSAHAKGLFDAGVRVVLRYYTSNMESAKLLSLDEARAICGAGLGIAVTYQVSQTDPEDFDRDKGEHAGKTAWNYARSTIGQPAGSAIYFAVDYDASSSDIEQRIAPYFEAARAQLRRGDLMQSYRIGVYGSGRVCAALLDRGLVDLAWLAAASRWGDHQRFQDSMRWALCQHPHTTIADVNVDPDEVQGSCVDFGQFTVPLAGRPVGKYRVTATTLNTRSAPDADATKVGSLAKGAVVDVAGFAGDAYGWAALTNPNEPGIMGYCSAKYLAVG